MITTTTTIIIINGTTGQGLLIMRFPDHVPGLHG
jgi:hypothetical protein